MMKQIAVRAAYAAGKILLKYYKKGIERIVKGKGDLVSKADLECEKKIISVIKSKYPDHSILSEEVGSEENDSSYRWIIDPLDGTHNYLYGIPLFGTCIALEKDGELVLGVIYLPIFDKMYVAEQGKGAFVNGKRLHVSDNSELSKAMGVYDGGLNTDTDLRLNSLKVLTKHLFRVRILGAACVNLVQIAEGHADVYMEHHTNPWDVSAGYVIIKEAGGELTQLDGSIYSDPTLGFVATNGKLHKKIVKITKKL